MANEIAAASASAIVNLPQVNHLKRTMRNQRGNDLPPNPINRAEIPNIPQEFPFNQIYEGFADNKARPLLNLCRR